MRKAIVFLLWLPILGCQGQVSQPSQPSTSQAERNPAAEPAATKPAPPIATVVTMTREDFYKAVYDKSPEDVIKAVGKPDKTVDDRTVGGYDLVYYWRKKTIDPVSGSVDELVTVDFRGFDAPPGRKAVYVKYKP